MEQIVRVRRILPDGQAEVLHIRESACSGDCHKCAGCGAAKQTMIVRAENPIGAPVGAAVRLHADTGGILKAAMVVYLLPILLFFGGYAFGAVSGIGGGVIGCLGFALGIGLAVAADRRMRAKHQTVYTIIGYAFSGADADSKGEHELG